MDKLIHIEYLRSIILGVCNLNSNPEFYLKCRHHLLLVNNINRRWGMKNLLGENTAFTEVFS